MRCPFCNHSESRVIDSRLVREGMAIRRRRGCEACGERFTTYETVQDVHPMVVKKDDDRQPFDRGKLVGGIHRACEKRPVPADTIEAFVDKIESSLLASGQREVRSQELGERVMSFLRAQDKVAYIRFASVYRSFEDVGDFVDTLRDLAAGEESEAGAIRSPDEA